MKNQEFHPIQYRWDSARGQYIAEAPDLPGFSSTADTVSELDSHIRESLAEWEDAVRERGAAMPAQAAQEVDTKMLAALGSRRYADHVWAPEDDDEDRGPEQEGVG